VIDLLCCLRGKDTFKFLQGLITNDLTKIDPTNKTTLNAAFLNPKGRIITTTYLYANKRDDDNPSIIIETHSKTAKQLESYLKAYKLRSKVTIERIPLGVAYSRNRLTVEDFGSNRSILFVSADNKIQGGEGGVRIVTRSGL
jgi:folate-binding Fe-S cluster repair protein YgfZ